MPLAVTSLRSHLFVRIRKYSACQRNVNNPEHIKFENQLPFMETWWCPILPTLETCQLIGKWCELTTLWSTLLVTWVQSNRSLPIWLISPFTGETKVRKKVSEPKLDFALCQWHLDLCISQRYYCSRTFLTPLVGSFVPSKKKIK